MLCHGTGEERAGKDLRASSIRRAASSRLIDGLHSRYSRSVVEQAAIAGAFDAQLLQSAEQANGIADLIAERLDAISEETEKGWEGRYGNDGFRFKREVRGVTEAHALDLALLGSLDARRLNERHQHLAEVYGTPGQAAAQGRDDPRLRPAHAARGRLRGRAKGHLDAALQRSGRDEPRPAWETTLDPDVARCCR